MRWLAAVSVLTLVGCASAPPQPQPRLSTDAVHPPLAPLDRPWLIPTPHDEITLFDTRTLRALRSLDEIPALNANGSGRVKRPGLWIGVGIGAAAAIVVITDDAVNGAFLNY